MGLPFCYSSYFVKSSTRQVGVCSRRSICPDTGYGVDYRAGILSALVHRDQHQFPGRPTLKTCLRTKTQLLRNGEQAPERNLLPPEDTFLSCTDTVQGLHRIFLEAALFLLCAAGSLQEHVCRVYPAFSSAYFGAELLNSNGAFSGSSAASTSDLDSSA